MNRFLHLQSLLRRPALSSLSTLTTRSFAFSSFEEAAAERRRLKRNQRIQPPLHRSNPPAPRTRPRPDPHAPRLPDTTSSLVGPRLSLHNKVQSLIRGDDLDAASATARHAVSSNTRVTVFTCNAVIASMHRAKRYTEAISHFQFFFNQCNIVPNVVSYNNLINAYCDIGKVDIGLDVYRHILANAPFFPSCVTYQHLTKGLIEADRMSDAIDLLREMLNKGLNADSLVYNNIISGFLKLGNFERANEFFDELKERCLVYDGIVNATFMEWFFNKGMEKEAMESYRGLLDRQFKMIPATCNVLLKVLLKYGKSEAANALFESMLNNHKIPNFYAVNSDTYNIMVNECFRLGKYSEALLVFRQCGTVLGSTPFKMDGAGYTNLIGKLCEHDMVEEAEKMFKEMVDRNEIMTSNTYKFLIEAYFKEDRVDDVLLLLNRFLFQTNLKANPHFFNMVFEGLLNKDRIEQAAEILGRMGDRDSKPDPSTYELVIRVLCNEGKLDRSWDLLGQMVRDKVVLTPALRSSVDEAFGKGGRLDDIERLLGKPHQPREGASMHAPPAKVPTIAHTPPPPVHQPREPTSAHAPMSPMH